MLAMTWKRRGLERTSRGGAYYSGPRARAGHPTRPADRVQHGHLLDRDGPLEGRRSRARSGRVELLRDLGSLLRLHDRLPGAEPAAGAGRRLRAERRLRPRLHRVARAEEAQGRVPARRRAVRADPRGAWRDHVAVHRHRPVGDPADHGRQVQRRARPADGRAVARDVPDRRAARAQWARGRDPQCLRPLRDPGDRARGVELRDHRRARPAEAAVRRPERGLRVRARRARGHRRPVRDVPAGAAARRVRAEDLLRLPRPAHPQGPAADAAGHDRARPDQLQPADQLGPRLAGRARGRRRRSTARSASTCSRRASSRSRWRPCCSRRCRASPPAATSTACAARAATACG